MAHLTRAQAERQANRLAHHIRKYGVPVAIDLRPGAGGNHWGVDTFHGAMAHHIASRRSQGLTPFYSLVRNGRSDVPGPLCNIYGGWDKVARIVTMGLANHSGKGGPWTVSGLRIPQDNGRYYFLGTEFEGGMSEADWDDDYRRFMAAVNAGKLDYIAELRGRTIADTALCEHSDWARPRGRKIDRLGYTQARGIAEVRALRAGTTPPGQPAPTPQEDDTMDLLFVSYDESGNAHHYGTLGPAHFTYVPNEADYINARTQLGREVKWWQNAANDRTVRSVGTIFGTYVGPEANRPKGA